jgi:putative spermidine/putrescine transport system permease protein
MSGVGTVERPGTAVPPRAKRGWRPELSWRAGLGMALPMLALVALFLVYPLIRLLTVAFGPPSGVHNFSGFFDSSADLKVMRVTFVDSAIVAVLSVVLGSVLAWTIRSTRFRAVRLFLIGVVFVPFWMGSVVKLYAFTIILERLGLVNRVLLKLHLIHQPLTLIYNQFAVIVGMVYQLLPYAVLPLVVVFNSIDEDLLRAAQGLGASRAKAIRNVVLPLSLPGLMASTTIVYVVGLGFFLTPVLLGGATSPFSASLMYDDIFQYFDFTSATVSAIVLLAGGAVVLLIAARLVGREQLRKALG